MEVSMRHRVAVLSLLGCLLFSLSAKAQVLNRGGSAFMSYNTDAYGNSSCYGVVRNYADPGAKSAIQQDLSSMYNDGQRRLTVMVFHIRGPYEPSCSQPGAMGIYLNSDYTNFDPN